MAGSGRRPFMQMVADVFRRRPIAAGTTSSAVLCGISDAIAQGMEAKQRERSRESGASVQANSALAQVPPMRRWAFMIGWGAALGAILPPWYSFMDRAIKPVLPRILVHQMTWSPACNFVFLGCCEVVRDSSQGVLARMQNKIEADWFYVTRFAFCFWGVYNVFAFYAVPPHLRTPLMAGVNCGWTVFLSWLGFRRVQLQAEEEQQEQCLALQNLAVS
mmetsp:Transcript_45874/g.109230  ORF Transcript_45874/g.109230 Transcript_45874/m.109230 type:complete len:218 (-) Transcript_45874:117-770(-)